MNRIRRGKYRLLLQGGLVVGLIGLTVGLEECLS